MNAGQTAVCVLGMSRSGTSLTARLLNLAGVYLGSEEDLLGGELRHLPAEDRDNARAANPGGFWEHYSLMRLNERILRRLGGNWREPPPMPPGWEDSEELDEERGQARALIEETFAGHALWGWKDPRNCLTLPFWQELIPCPRYVVCVRNPVDVAASLERRDGIPFEQAVELWETYMRAALVATEGRRRLIVSYESHFEDPYGAAARLAAFCGRDGAFAGQVSGELLAETIDESLWRNRAGSTGDAASDSLPAEVLAMHRTVERLAKSHGLPQAG